MALFLYSWLISTFHFHLLLGCLECIFVFLFRLPHFRVKLCCPPYLLLECAALTCFLPCEPVSPVFVLLHQLPNPFPALVGVPAPSRRAGCLASWAGYGLAVLLDVSLPHVHLRGCSLSRRRSYVDQGFCFGQIRHSRWLMLVLIGVARADGCWYMVIGASRHWLLWGSLHLHKQLRFPPFSFYDSSNRSDLYHTQTRSNKSLVRLLPEPEPYALMIPRIHLTFGRIRVVQGHVQDALAEFGDRPLRLLPGDELVWGLPGRAFDVPVQHCGCPLDDPRKYWMLGGYLLVDVLLHRELHGPQLALDSLHRVLDSAIGS